MVLFGANLSESIGFRWHSILPKSNGVSLSYSTHVAIIVSELIPELMCGPNTNRIPFFFAIDSVSP